MWKLKLTYFYVKFFYSLIFNKLWKPGGCLCLSVCFPLEEEESFYSLTFSNVLIEAVTTYLTHWLSKIRT